MKKNFNFLFLFGLLMLAACKKANLPEAVPAETKAVVQRLQTAAITTIYYVDDTGGSDSNSGTSTTTAWKTISKVNSTTFVAGNQIRFKRGGSWSNQLHPLGSGTSGSPIVIDAYGSGNLPIINGLGVANGTIYLNNQEYWEVTNLEITNYKSSEEGGQSLSAWETSNTTNYANVTLPSKYNNTNTAKYGVYVAASNRGATHHIYLKNLVIHGVNGTIDQTESSKNNGGVYFHVSGSTTATWFDDLLVDNCNIHDVDRTGLLFDSSWDGNRTLTSNGGWSPALNIVVSNCIFNKTGANALIVRDASGPLMEHNLFDHCAIKGSGNAGFNFNTDNAKWQMNECRYTKANVGDNDAGGLDADYKTKNTIIQYNWLHNNDFGVLITGGDGYFNDGTQFKYNIIEKDGAYAQAGTDKGKFIFKISGSATNTMIYNNTVDIGPSQTDTKIALHWTWGSGTPNNTTYYNNIIDNSGTGSFYDLNGSTGNTFDYNAFYKNTAGSQPSQTHNISGDVKFVNPGAGDPNGYWLKTGSVAYNAGKVISGNGGRDYFGNSVSTSSASNVGAYNGPLQ
jgi:hypothetical protein